MSRTAHHFGSPFQRIARPQRRIPLSRPLTLSPAISHPSANGSDYAPAASYSRSTFTMQAGQNAEASAALEQTGKLNPDFTEARGKLAILYQKTGDSIAASHFPAQFR